MRYRSVRQHAVAEIEDKRSSREAFQYVIDSTIERFPANQERHWIEVALNRLLRLQLFAREPKINRPVQSNGINRDCSDVSPQFAAGAARKADNLSRRYPRSDRRSNARAGFHAAPVKLVTCHDPRPCVENLHGIDASLELADQIISRGVDQDISQGPELVRMPVSKFTGWKLIGRSRPGNHVRCQCPWRSTKTKQCDVPRQLFFHAPNRFIDGRKSLMIELVP